MKRILVIASLIIVALAAVAIPALRAQSGNLWTIDYFPNTDWAGTPTLRQTANYIAFNWGYGSPGAGVPSDNFTATMVSDPYFYSGVYRFSLLADDEMALTVDGVKYLDTRNAGQSGKSFTVDIPMSQGYHHVEVNYREYTAAAYVYVDWQPLKGSTPTPGAPTPTPNPNQCKPKSATSVQTQYGNYDSCIQQNIHQQYCFQSDGAWNSPNLGSIQTEPQIEIWGNCTPDSTTFFTVSCDPAVPQKEYKCSKTGAGWFPN